MKLKDKRVIVTGASSGIGKGFAIRAAQDGATVYLAARSADKLEQTKKEVEEAGGIGIVVPTDVTSVEEVRALFLQASEDGVVDVVFNNAGIGFVGAIWEMPVDQIEKTIDVNVKGMIMVSKFASEVMQRQEHGHIIMTSSLAGLVGLPDWSIYAASKWAITGFSNSIRTELKPYGVYVSTLHPGAVDTNFFKQGDIAEAAQAGSDVEIIQPSDVAEEVYKAIFTNQKKILVPNMVKQVNFLNKVMPGLVDNLMANLVKDAKEAAEMIEEDEPEFDEVVEKSAKE